MGWDLDWKRWREDSKICKSANWRGKTIWITSKHWQDKNVGVWKQREKKIISVEENEIENVERFTVTYLGSNVTADLEYNKEISVENSKSTRKFTGAGKLIEELINQLISVQTKHSVWKTCKFSSESDACIAIWCVVIHVGGQWVCGRQHQQLPAWADTSSRYVDSSSYVNLCSLHCTRSECEFIAAQC